VHSLAEAGVAHFFLAHLDADSVEALVQGKVERHLNESRCSQVFAPGEDPADLVYVGISVGDPEVERGGDDENRHLHRQEMSLEKAVEQDQQAAVVGSWQGVGDNIREDAALRRNLETEFVDLDIRNIGIGVVVPAPC